VPVEATEALQESSEDAGTELEAVRVTVGIDSGPTE
jgi:hypothetical protein